MHARTCTVLVHNSSLSCSCKGCFRPTINPLRPVKYFKWTLSQTQNIPTASDKNISCKATADKSKWNSSFIPTIWFLASRQHIYTRLYEPLSRHKHFKSNLSWQCIQTSILQPYAYITQKALKFSSQNNSHKCASSGCFYPSRQISVLRPCALTINDALYVERPLKGSIFCHLCLLNTSACFSVP